MASPQTNDRVLRTLSRTLSVPEIAGLFQVTERTVAYWRRHGAPHYARERLALVDGEHPDWPGFQIRAGHIITPGGATVGRNEIEAHPWLAGLLHVEAQRANAAEERVRSRSTLLQTSS